MEVKLSTLEEAPLQRTPVPLAPANESPSSPEPHPPNRHFAAISVAAGLVLACAVGWRIWTHAAQWTSTDNATVAGHIHNISSRVPGTVSEVLVQDNAVVEAGAVLARLDTRDLAVKRDQARAAVSEAKAQVALSKSQRIQADARLAEEHAQLRKAELDFARAEHLFKEAAGAISRQEFDNAGAALDARKASVSAVEAALKSAGAAIEAAEAQYAAAEAVLSEAELQLSYTELRAPVAGRIGRKNIEAGNRVQPGQAVLALVGKDVWINANFKETQLARMKIGQRVQIRIDAVPGRVFEGVVDSFASASGAQFALLPPDNATGNFTKIVQRVAVKIVFAEAALSAFADRVVPGMSAVVDVNVAE